MIHKVKFNFADINNLKIRYLRYNGIYFENFNLMYPEVVKSFCFQGYQWKPI